MRVDREKLRWKVHVHLACESEDSHYTDGHFQREDGSNDDELCEKIRRDLAAGNDWAWCVAKVTASYGGIRAETFLGGCSYESEDDFVNGGYYEQMVRDCVDEIADKLERAADADIWQHRGGPMERTRHVDSERVVHIAGTRFGTSSDMVCEAGEATRAFLKFDHGGPVDYPVTCLTCLVRDVEG